MPKTIKAPESFADLPFPKKGIDLFTRFGMQRYGTTPIGQNVRAFEPTTNRSRGGQRPGLVKYLANQPAGIVWVPQDLTVMVGTYQPPGGLVQNSQSGRVVTLVTVVQGNVIVANAGDTDWTPAFNASGENPPLNFTGLMFSTANNQKLWFADGINYCYYDPNVNTVFPWLVGTYQPGDTGGVAGTAMGALPVDDLGNTPRLIETWRGRIVLSGLINDPQNWFMSAVGDPTNFDYGPLSTTPAQAIAGNNAPQGLIGDVVTAIIPYTDDVCVFGGDHTIYMMRGDPMAGGQIDLVSDAIGIAWGRAWTKDPIGNIYFVSNKTGIYTLVPGQAPQRISQQIEQLLSSIDTGANSIRLIWNDRFQGLHVFITPTDAPATCTHLFYETRTGAWWTDQFANNNHNPLCCCTFDGNTPGDRVALIGSWDGYVRAISATAPDDDGTAIQSAVVVGPLLTKDLDDVLVKDLQAILGAASGQVNYAVYVGQTAEIALASAPVVSGVWGPGRNFSTFVRRSGHAIYVKITASSPWSMETIRARIAGLGKVRRRDKA
jgi:hypothetical protein